MSDKQTSPIWAHILRIADLPTKKPTRFELTPNAKVLSAIVADLGLLGLKKVTFKGELRPLGKRDWELRATIGATIVQPCVVTLDPVTTRIHEDVMRTYLHELPDYESGSEVEMQEEETTEQLQPEIDIGEVMLESLVLNLPLYPRSDGAKLAQAEFTEPGKAAMKDEDARPFAGLRSLRDNLKKDGE